MTPYECYVRYLATKLHLTRMEYDGPKFNWKVKSTRESFEKRNDRVWFDKLSRHRDPVGMLTANLVRDPRLWIRDLVKGDDEWVDWKRRTESLSYVFKTEIGNLDGGIDYQLKSQDGQHPPFLRAYFGKRVSPETLAIMTDLTGCAEFWLSSMPDDDMVKSAAILGAKYGGLIEYDSKKMRKIALDKFYGYQRDSVDAVPAA